ncbi:MAG: aspartate-semialdehyde dehydrogenase [Phycisphaerales bacterium]|nr:aspartate-semialdehyde dehydrogenase [Phycisphaerales bacterium]
MIPTIAIVGATGAVGREMLTILEQWGPNALRGQSPDPLLLASPRSVGTTVPFRGKELTVRALEATSFRGIKIALFSAGGSIAREYGPAAARGLGGGGGAGATVIDNSSAFRMTAGVPLVVPEINPEALHLAPLVDHAPGRIIANPNCSAIILLMALTPLRKAFGVTHAIVSTYQAASGAGARGMDELLSQTRSVLEAGVDRGGGAGGGGALTPKVFKEPYAFNLFSHNTDVDPVTGLNVEEQKVIDETGKIWGTPVNEGSRAGDTAANRGLGLSITCIRVPTLRAHAQSVHVTLGKPATTHEVREALAAAPGVRLLDDRAANSFPTPLKATGTDEVLVGRIRPDRSGLGRSMEGGVRGQPGFPSETGPITDDSPSRAFELFVCGDQLRKGAALNALQIARLVAG